MNEEKYARNGACSCGRNAPEGVFRTSWRSRDNTPCRCSEAEEAICPDCAIDKARTCTSCQREAKTCNNCSTGIDEECLLQDRSLAMVYAASQKFEGVYEPRKALNRGTAFCGLDKPFYGDRRD